MVSPEPHIVQKSWVCVLCMRAAKRSKCLGSVTFLTLILNPSLTLLTFLCTNLSKEQFIWKTEEELASAAAKMLLSQLLKVFINCSEKYSD
jgi:hypothetical protein